jgi:hypothetical protein
MTSERQAAYIVIAFILFMVLEGFNLILRLF